MGQKKDRGGIGSGRGKGRPGMGEGSGRTVAQVTVRPGEGRTGIRSVGVGVGRTSVAGPKGN